VEGVKVNQLNNNNVDQRAGKLTKTRFRKWRTQADALVRWVDVGVVDGTESLFEQSGNER
jgi:hypothetical protein